MAKLAKKERIGSWQRHTPELAGADEEVMFSENSALAGSGVVNDGDVFVPGYEIMEQVGQGAMSTVYLARHEDDKVVVLKVFFTRALDDPTILRRFMQEYTIISKLDHPNVVKIYERAFAADFAYIAMEYFSGGDLKDKMRAGIPPVDASLNYLHQMASGLSPVHHMGVVHRDLKPGNILFRQDGRLAITDFGVARMLTEQTGRLTLSNDMVIGTPYYMSPEQGLGRMSMQEVIFTVWGLFSSKCWPEKNPISARAYLISFQPTSISPFLTCPATCLNISRLSMGCWQKNPMNDFKAPMN